MEEVPHGLLLRAALRQTDQAACLSNTRGGRHHHRTLGDGMPGVDDYLQLRGDRPTGHALHNKIDQLG